MKLLTTIALLGCTFTLAAHAETTLLRGPRVTETNLLNALTPPPAPLVLRSLRVSRTDDASLMLNDAAPAAAKKPSASLLITFETNSSQLTSPARKQLDVVASALKNDKLTGYRFAIEGHADPRGSHDANLVLSRQRAESVRGYLVASHGIAGERLWAEGKGDTEPLNAQVPAAAENRRVTIVTQTP